MSQKKINPFPLRMNPDIRWWAEEKARKNDRSLNWLLNNELRKLKQAEQVSTNV